MEEWRKIQGWFTSEDVDAYRHCVNQLSPNSIICEIGSFLGRSSMSILPLCAEKNCHLFCVDLFTMSDEFRVESQLPVLAMPNNVSFLPTFRANTHQYNHWLTPLMLPSSEAAKAMRLLGVKFDLVFVDACHKYELVKADIDAWLPLVKSGGWMAGHDSDWPGVEQAVTETFPKFEVGAGSSVWMAQTRG